MTDKNAKPERASRASKPRRPAAKPQAKVDGNTSRLIDQRIVSHAFPTPVPFVNRTNGVLVFFSIPVDGYRQQILIIRGIRILNTDNQNEEAGRLEDVFYFDLADGARLSAKPSPRGDVGGKRAFEIRNELRHGFRK